MQTQSPFYGKHDRSLLGFQVTLIGKCNVNPSYKMLASDTKQIHSGALFMWTLTLNTNSYSQIITKQQQNDNRVIWMCVCLGQWVDYLYLLSVQDCVQDVNMPLWYEFECGHTVWMWLSRHVTFSELFLCPGCSFIPKAAKFMNKYIWSAEFLRYI